MLHRDPERFPFQEGDDESNSTHGINVLNIKMPAAPERDPLELNLWDFGGQDIYHGTHSLFATGIGVFLLVWDQVTEREKHHEFAGYVSENHDLGYWLSYIRQVSNPSSPIIICQNKIDVHDRQPAPIPDEVRAPFAVGQLRETHCSARDGWRGLEHLVTELRNAAEEVRTNHRLARIGEPGSRCPGRRSGPCEGPCDRQAYCCACRAST